MRLVNPVLIIHLNAVLIPMEGMSFVVARGLVLGPHDDAIERYDLVNHALRYYADLATLQRIVQLLETRCWNRAEYAMNRRDPSLQSLLQTITKYDHGSFDQWMTFFLTKIVRTEIVDEFDERPRQTRD